MNLALTAKFSAVALFNASAFLENADFTPALKSGNHLEDLPLGF
jgi:hypothetical protein